MRNPFKALTKFEWFLWSASVIAVICALVLPQQKDLFSCIGSLIGVTALIFTAKGDIWGQILIIIFAVFYSVVSFSRQYYGEMITYLGMSAPMAVLALVAWLRHPFKGKKAEVEVRKLCLRDVTLCLILALAVTLVFYFILRAFNTAELPLSTLSVATSFIAAYMTYLRSPFYALGYAANDAVLIALWIIAAVEDPSHISMVICFVVFLINDLYGFFNWLKMKKRQSDT